MSGELFTASINALILDLEGRAARVRHSLSVLKHPDSPYAHAHRALLAAYDAALSSLKVHRAAFVSPAVEVPGGATGPQCPICCSPSWPMEGSGSMWCCTRPGCPVSSFVLTDHLPMPAEDVAAAMEAAKVEAVAVPTEVAAPLSYVVNGREVLSVAGAQQLARETFPDGVPPVPPPSHLSGLTALLFADPNAPEEPSHG